MLSKTRTRLSILTSIAVSTMASLSQAHEFWVQPETHKIAPGGLLGVTLMHGERFMGEPVHRNTPKIRRYELVAPGHDPARVAGMHGHAEGFIRPQHAGVLVYQTRHYRNNLEAKEFHAYLEEEGLGEIAQRREKLGELETQGREVYSRCAKAVIHMADGEGDASEIDHDTGLPLEITLRAITRQSADPVVTATVVFLGEPLADQRVVATSADAPERLLELRTDANGEVRFEGDAGQWMLTTLHIRRADAVKGADWESFWASNTFQIWE